MDYLIINKYLNGEASESEVQEIFKWMNADPKNRDEFIQYKKIWALTATSPTNPNKAWNVFFKTLARPKEKNLIVLRYWMVAAGILLIFSLGMMMQYLFSPYQRQQFSYQTDTRIEVPLGQMSSIVLPDGTKVHLNSGTKLIYSGSFNAGERTVSMEGEAFFEVTKDAQHPFIIKTKSLDFKVYGTTFNIQAYPEDNEVDAALVEGSLGIIDPNGCELIRLVPGENASYRDEDKKVSVSQVPLEMYTSWKDGLVTFKNEKLKNIARTLERWYNVEIIIKKASLGEEVYMGSILKNKPIDQILEVFALTSSLKYRIVPRADRRTLIYWE